MTWSKAEIIKERLAHGGAQLSSVNTVGAGDGEGGVSGVDAVCDSLFDLDSESLRVAMKEVFGGRIDSGGCRTASPARSKVVLCDDLQDVIRSRQHLAASLITQCPDNAFL